VEQLAVVLDEPDHGHGLAHPGREALEGSTVVGHEAPLEHEVLGRVARGPELREAGDVGLGRLGLPLGVEHPVDVAVQVTDRQVHLAQGHPQRLHAPTLPTGRQPQPWVASGRGVAPGPARRGPGRGGAPAGRERAGAAPQRPPRPSGARR
jgi:hypothetical protein